MITGNDELKKIDYMLLTAIKSSKDLKKYDTIKDYFKLIINEFKPKFDEFGITETVFKNLKSFDANIIYSFLNDNFILTDSTDSFYLIDTMSVAFTQKGVLFKTILEYFNNEINLDVCLNKIIKYISKRYCQVLNKSYKETSTNDEKLKDFFGKYDDNAITTQISNHQFVNIKTDYDKFKNSNDNEFYYYRNQSNMTSLLINNILDVDLSDKIVSIVIEKGDEINIDFFIDLFNNNYDIYFINKTILKQLINSSILKLNKKPVLYTSSGFNSWVSKMSGLSYSLNHSLYNDVKELFYLMNELDDFNIFNANYKIVDLVQQLRASKYSDLFFYKLLSSK